MTNFDNLQRPPLNESALRKALVVPGSFVTDVRVVESTGSTNADLRELAVNGAPEGTVVAAEEQTQGRGRLDRRWSAPARSGLAVSVLVRPNLAPSRWGWLPLMVGLSVVLAIDRVAAASEVSDGSPIGQLKWPNDVMISDRKVGGILVERVETPRGPSAVIGMGLNVSLTESELPVATATSLALAGHVMDRDPLLRAYLRAVAEEYLHWSSGRSMADRYRARSQTLGRKVVVTRAVGADIVGWALDVDDVGQLLVNTADGVVAVSAGDVQHVR